MKGAGIWLRLGSRPTPEQVVEHLDHVVVPLHSGERGPIHVGPTLRSWCREVRAGGVELWGMDWLPEAHGGTAHVEPMMAAARELGCTGVEGDCEPDAGWRGAVREAVAYRAALAEHRGDLDLAITDYARGGVGRATLRALLEEVDGHRPIGVPQSYDPAGRYEPDYHGRSVAYWRDCGAERVLLGVGAWLRGERRHRTPEEMRRHLEHVSSDVLGVRAWYASAKALAPLLPVLAEHRVGDRDVKPAPRPAPRDLEIPEWAWSVATGCVLDQGDVIVTEQHEHPIALALARLRWECLHPADYAARVAELAEDAPARERAILLDAARRLGELRVCG